MEPTLMLDTVSSALALRFDQIGLRHHFAVACDYALVFLNQLLTNKDLKQSNRTNELNFCFNAPGYTRAPGATRGLAPLWQRTL
jgi:pyruvate decarboxylase